MTACAEMVSSLSFYNCSVATNVLETLCLQSLCQCTTNDFQECLCDAIASYSRLCVARGAHLQEWRTDAFCRKLQFLVRKRYVSNAFFSSSS